MKNDMRNFKFSLFSMLLLLLWSGVVAQEIEEKKLWQPYYITPRTADQHIDLSSDWVLGYRDSPIQQIVQVDDIGEWITVEHPTSVQWALHKAGKLPHPYEHQNSLQYRWVEDKLWYYRKEFEVPENDEYVFLCFDGLDYFSRVWLNGELLGKHEGMFGGPSIEISDKIKHGEKNTLVVEVASGNRDPEIRNVYAPRGETLASDSKKMGEGAPIVKGWAFTGGAGAEHYYTLGMWQGARIELVPKAHIERPYVHTKRISANEAVISFSAEVFVNAHSLQYRMHPSGNAILSRGIPTTKLEEVEKPLALEITWVYQGKVVYAKKIPLQVFEGRTWVNEELVIENPKLWWPNGMGDPNLYEVNLSLLEGDEIKDVIEFDFGIRTIERMPSAGTQVEELWEDWHFVVNGKPIFVRGSNWMPVDWLLDLPEDRYRWLLEMAQQSGMQMMRVWASGLQETETFYKLCNELGIMVWQDFQISHVNTPNWPQDVVAAHVMQNIYRLRNKPSLALWNGGNGMNPFADDNSTITGITERYVHMFDPSRFYSRTSSAAGNAHLYPDMDPSWYARLYKYVPFISETGMHAIPSPENLKKVIAAEEFEDLGEMYSDDFAKSHKDIIHHFVEFNPTRVPRMISRASHIDDMRNPTIASISEASQIGSGEFYQVLTDGMLSNYPNSTGLLYWVFNRMWPVFSAIMLVDGHSQPIAPYYFTKRSFEQLHVSVQMDRLLWAAGEDVSLSPSVINHLDQSVENATVEIVVMDDQFKMLQRNEQALNIEKGVSLSKLNRETFAIPTQYTDRFFFVVANLRDSEGQLLSRSVYWPRSTSIMQDTAYRDAYIKSPQDWPVFENGPWLKPTVAKTKTELRVEDATLVKTAADRLTLSAQIINEGKNPAFLTQLDIAEDYRFYASDNFFWLAPGESKAVELVIWLDKPLGQSSIEFKLSAWNTKVKSQHVHVE